MQPKSPNSRRNVSMCYNLPLEDGTTMQVCNEMFSSTPGSIYKLRKSDTKGRVPFMTHCLIQITSMVFLNHIIVMCYQILRLYLSIYLFVCFSSSITLHVITSHNTRYHECCYQMYNPVTSMSHVFFRFYHINLTKNHYILFLYSSIMYFCTHNKENMMQSMLSLFHHLAIQFSQLQNFSFCGTIKYGIFRYN